MYALLLIEKQYSVALTLSYVAVSVKKLQCAKFKMHSRALIFFLIFEANWILQCRNVSLQLDALSRMLWNFVGETGVIFDFIYVKLIFLLFLRGTGWNSGNTHRLLKTVTRYLHILLRDRTFRRTTFHRRTFRRRTFCRRTFRRTDTSPYGQFAVRRFCREDTSP